MVFFKTNPFDRDKNLKNNVIIIHTQKIKYIQKKTRLVEKKNGRRRKFFKC